MTLNDSQMTTIYLKGIPEDIAKYILKIQWENKIKKGVGTYSQSQSVIQIIKEHKRQNEK